MASTSPTSTRPYNQHPYGSNYFMLNLLVDYEEPTTSARSLGSQRMERSGYNVARTVAAAFIADLLDGCRRAVSLGVV